MAPLSQAFVKVRPDVTGFKGEAEKGITGAGLGKLGESHGRAFGTSFGTRAGEAAGSSLSTKLTDLGRKLGPGLAAAFAVDGLKVAFERTIGGASDLNETISKSQQVFKGSAGEILKWSQTSATAMGLSQRAALDGASSFENLFSQIGITGNAATGMSKNLVQLASDFASFHNARPEDVMDALLSATRGEYDALQKFVPTVSAAAIETEALAESGKASAKELTNAEKATALYNLVVKGAGAATGDFARTSTGAANQQRILAANMENTAASVGNVLLPAYTGVLQAVNDIGPGTLAAAAAVAVLSNRMAATGAGAGVFRDVGAAFGLYRESVTAGTPRITAALDTAKASLTGLRSAGSSLLGVFGGPWGLALTAATIGVGLLTNKIADNRAKAEAATAAYLRFGDAVKQATTSGEVARLIEQDKAIQGLIVDTDKYGISTKDVVGSLSGQKDATDRVIAALEAKKAALYDAAQAAGAEAESATGAYQQEIDAVNKVEAQFKKTAEERKRAAAAQDLYTTAISETSAAAALSEVVFNQLAPLVDAFSDKTSQGADLAKVYATSLKDIGDAAIPGGTALGEYGAIADTVAGAHLNAAQRADAFKTILSGVTSTAGASGPVMDTLGQVFSNVATAELSASDRAAVLKSTWEAMYQPAINQTDATQNFNLALFGLKDQIDKSSTSLDINKTAGINNRIAVEDLIKRNNDLYFANIAAGMSAEDAARQHHDNGEKIREAGKKANLSEGDVRKLNDEYGRIPPKKETQVTLVGADKVYEDLLNLKIAQLALSQGIDVAEARRQIRNQTGRGTGGFREGGPVFGPGTGTSDSIAARLSAGEHVWTAKEVQSAGGHAAVEALRAIVLRGQSPKVRRPGDGSEGVAFAGGGAVWPFPVTAAKTKIPQMPSVQAGLDAQAFIRAQAGKPYIWASAGPAGYDCSGIVSAAWNLLHGQYPYSHTFSTMDQAGYFPLGGAGGILTAGWSNAGERGGGSVGHTAARIGGLMFESRGGDGVVVGSGVTPLSSFSHIGHYDQGGRWPTGTLGLNSTGRTEYVSSPDAMDTQTALLREILGAIERVAPGVGRELGNAGRSAMQAARST